METDLHQIIVSPQTLNEDHIKVFLYQILRGIKYLHSAGIIHRDLKPGNLLVNSNCVVRICDFGFARALATNPKTAMTLEVVTQYYRAPELLAGCVQYGTAIDMWATGCIVAELLGRKILFMAPNTSEQLEMITDLLGSPAPEDLTHLNSCDAIKRMLSKQKPSALHNLYKLSPLSTHGLVHLLTQLLVFNPGKRISCADALSHPYVDDGRIRYHSFMCSCCYTINGMRRFSHDMEPVSHTRFNQSYERDLTSVATAKAQIFSYISSINAHLPSLHIDQTSNQYQHFLK
jgi:nemo like kinase